MPARKNRPPSRAPKAPRPPVRGGGSPVRGAPSGGEVADSANTELLVSLPFCESYSPVDDPGQQDVCFWIDCHQGELDISTDPPSPGDPRVVRPGRPIHVKGRYKRVTIHGHGKPKDGDRDINNAGHIHPC